MTRGGHLRSIAILKMHEMYVRSLSLSLSHAHTRARIHLLELLSLPTPYLNKPTLLAIEIIRGIKGARAWELYLFKRSWSLEAMRRFRSSLDPQIPP